MASYNPNCGILPPSIPNSQLSYYPPTHIPPPTYNQPPIGVFWDIENCRIPTGKSALTICDLIRKQKFFEGHSEKQFVVVCDSRKENSRVLEEIDKAQVDVIHVAANQKNAADEKLKNVMRRFADQHGQGARIVLISGDIDFAADISDFKRRKCLSVILIHPSAVSQALLMAATDTYDYNQLVSTVAMKSEVVPQYQSLELTVSNLPSISDCSKEYILDKLNAIGKNYDGKVVEADIRNGSAILQFATGAKADRFKRRFTHYDIGGRKINIWNSRGRRGKSPLSRNQSPWKPIGQWRSVSKSPGPQKRPSSCRSFVTNRNTQTKMQRGKSVSSSGDEVVIEEIGDKIKCLNIGEELVSLTKGKREGEISEVKRGGYSSSYSGDLSSADDLDTTPTVGMNLNSTSQSGFHGNSTLNPGFNEQHEVKFKKLKRKSRKQSGSSLQDGNVATENGPECVKMLIYFTNITSTCSDIEVRLIQEKIAEQNIKIKSCSKPEWSSNGESIKFEIDAENFDEAVKLFQYFDQSKLDGFGINIEFLNNFDEIKYRAEQVLIKLRGEATWTQFRETYSDLYKNGISLLQAKELSNVEIIDKDEGKCIALKNASLLWKMISMEEQEQILNNIKQLLYEKPEYTMPLDNIKEEYFKRFGRTIQSLVSLVAEDNFSTIRILKNEILSLPKAAVIKIISRNLNTLISDFPASIIPLGLVINLYEEKFGGNLITILGEQEIKSLPHLIDQCGKPLITINYNMTPQLTTVEGKFVADFVKRVLETFFQIFDSRNVSTVPAPLFLDEYRIMHGPYTFVDLDYIYRELGDMVICLMEDGQKLLELTPLYRLGNEIVMVLRENGGVMLLCNLQSEYNRMWHKNLQPVRYGYPNLETLLLELDLFVKVKSKNGAKSVLLKSLYDQHCLREGRARSDSGSRHRSGTPPISRSLFDNYKQSPRNTQQALRSTPDILGHISQKASPNVCQGVRSVQQEQMLGAGINISPKEKMRMAPTLSCNITRSSPALAARTRSESIQSNSTRSSPATTDRTRNKSIRSNSTSSKEESDSLEHPPSPAYSTGNKDTIITLSESDDDDSNSRSDSAAQAENQLASVKQHQVHLAKRRTRKNHRMAAFFPEAN